jgi:hypothetical protein
MGGCGEEMVKEKGGRGPGWDPSSPLLLLLPLSHSKGHPELNYNYLVIVLVSLVLNLHSVQINEHSLIQFVYLL